MTLRKPFEGDLKKMELTWGTAESEAKDRLSWRKRNGCIILNGQRQQKKKKYESEATLYLVTDKFQNVADHIDMQMNIKFTIIIMKEQLLF